VFVNIDQPAGRPVCWAVGKKVTEVGTCIIGLSLACATVETGPVFPIVTTMSMVPPTITTPEFDGNTFINGFACPKTFNAISVVASVKIISLKNFIFYLFCICDL
jgi:hypothetical protein